MAALGWTPCDTRDNESGTRYLARRITLDNQRYDFKFSSVLPSITEYYVA